ncbi:hypothetical protein [Streptomyces mirabilis]|uniref:hypothetical protein n=1 Tax=Streptomyces mirabilis TaxID=68239 RepID=UPI00324DD354
MAWSPRPPTAATQFDTIHAAAAPELAGHAHAVAFDADTGRLDVVPDAPAYGSKLGWIAPKLIAATNATVPGANAHSLHVLLTAVGKTGHATAAADLDRQPAPPDGPMRTRPLRCCARRSSSTWRPPRST